LLPQHDIEAIPVNDTAPDKSSGIRLLNDCGLSGAQRNDPTRANQSDPNFRPAPFSPEGETMEPPLGGTGKSYRRAMVAERVDYEV
jgi:hypothetical protein